MSHTIYLYSNHWLLYCYFYCLYINTNTQAFLIWGRTTSGPEDTGVNSAFVLLLWGFEVWPCATQLTALCFSSHHLWNRDNKHIVEWETMHPNFLSRTLMKYFHCCLFFLQWEVLTVAWITDRFTYWTNLEKITPCSLSNAWFIFHSSDARYYSLASRCLISSLCPTEKDFAAAFRNLSPVVVLMFNLNMHLWLNILFSETCSFFFCFNLSNMWSFHLKITE